MSTLKVGGIRGTGASADAITVNPTDGTCTAEITNKISNRNILINGAMRIRQRGDVVNAGNEYGGPDRWFFWKNDGAFNISQTDTVPTGQGFKNCYKIDCTSTSGASGAYYVGILQKLEGKDVMRLKYGSSNAESLTLSFWIRSTKTGTYIATLENKDRTKHISKSYTVSASNTWEKKTITFPGDTASGAEFDNDTGESLKLILWVFAGSSYTSGTLATSWASVVDANSAVGQVNAGDNTSNDIYFTGIQLEPGDYATDFEHKSYGEELARCQRYYYKHVEGTSKSIGIGQMYSGTNCSTNVFFPVTMRTAPAIDATSGANYYFLYGNGNSAGIDGSLSVWLSGENASFIESTSDADIGGGIATRWVTNDASAYIGFNSEL